MGFQVPKMVSVDNQRLVQLYYSLLVMSIAFNLYRFLHDQGFSSTSRIQTMAYIRVHEGRSRPLMDPAQYQMLTWQPLCKRIAGSLSGEVLEKAGLTFNELEPYCLPMCMPADIPSLASNPDSCFGISDVYFSDDAMNLKIITSDSSYELSYDGGTGALVTSTKQAKLYPSVKYMSLEVTFEYHLSESPGFFFGMNPTRATMVGAASSAWVVIMQDSPMTGTSTNTPWKTFPPVETGGNRTINVTMTDLIHAHFGSPAFPFGMGSPEMPESVLKDGLEYHVKLDCYNNKMDTMEVLDFEAFTVLAGEIVELSDKSPVCLLEFHMIAQEGVISRTRMDVQNSSNVVLATWSETVGIIFLCKNGSGYFRYPNLNTSMSNIISFIVMVSLPIQLVFFFMRTGLGHLSRVYKQATCEHFDLISELSNWSVGVMASSVAFESLADVKEHESSNTGTKRISRSRFAERLTVALQRYEKTLGQDERANIVNFASEEVCKVTQPNACSTCMKVGCGKRSRQVEEADAVGRDLGLDMNSFNKAVTHPRIQFSTIVEIMDKDIKRGCLETIFMPKVIKEKLHNVQGMPGTDEAYKASNDGHTSLEEQHQRIIENKVEEMMASTTGPMSPGAITEGAQEERMDKLEKQIKRLAAACSVWAGSSMQTLGSEQTDGAWDPSKTPRGNKLDEPITAEGWMKWRAETATELVRNREAMQELLHELAQERLKNARLAAELQAALQVRSTPRDPRIEQLLEQAGQNPREALGAALTAAPQQPSPVASESVALGFVSSASAASFGAPGSSNDPPGAASFGAPGSPSNVIPG